MENKFEFVTHPKIKHLRIIVNQIAFCNAHVHSDFEFAMLLKGKGLVTINNKKFDMSPGDIVLINSGEQHSYSALTPTNRVLKDMLKNETPLFLIFQISNHFLREYFPDIRNTLFESCKTTSYIPKEYISKSRAFLLRIAKNYFEAKDYFQYQLVSDLALLFKYCYTYIPHKLITNEEKEKLKKKNDRIQRIVNYIDENYTSQLRLEEIAEAENITTTHISHIFKDSFGVTFQEYVNIKRLEESIHLMTETDKSLIDIAFESGFSDPKYMTKTFKKFFNCKPKEFKDQASLNKLHTANHESKKDEHWYNDIDSLKEINEFFLTLN